MAKKALDDLLKELKDTSVTSGWDALALYDQRAANDLLAAQYVERFTGDDYIAPVDFNVPISEGGAGAVMSGLKFSAPRLSFEDADAQGKPVARLTLDMLGGRIVSTLKDSGRPPFVNAIQQCQPFGSPQIYMSQPISTPEISAQGDITLDMAKAEQFMATFRLAGLDAVEIGAKFKEFFDTRLTAAQKKFPLGKLTEALNGELTPKGYVMRVVKADPLAVLGDEAYGEGALMLFITLKDGQDGTTFPARDSAYLLPADGDGKKYTGALYLSSRVMFEGFRPGLKADIGNNVDFFEYGGDHKAAWSLKANSGGEAFVRDFTIPAAEPYNESVVRINFKSPYAADGGGDPLIFKASGSGVECLFNKDYLLDVEENVKGAGGSAGLSYRGTMSLKVQMEKRFDIDADYTTGMIAFYPSSSDVLLVSVNIVLNGPGQIGGNDEWVIAEACRAHYKKLHDNSFKSLKLPPVNMFLLNNLLFSNNSLLQIQHAVMPGDLALYGKIEPSRTAAALSPGISYQEPGSTLQFELSQPVTNMRWAARDVHGDILLGDAISADGRLTLPSADRLDGALSILVEVIGALNGQPASAFALVTVAGQTLSASPLIARGYPGKPVLLSGEVVDNSLLTWDIRKSYAGGELKTVEGKPNQREYIPDPANEGAEPFYIDEIEASCTVNGSQHSALTKVLVINQNVTEDIAFPEGWVPNSKTVAFELTGDQGRYQPDSWSLLAGKGTITEQGVYTQPDTVGAEDFAVITTITTVKIGPKLKTIRGVFIVVLPLNDFASLLASGS